MNKNDVINYITTTPHNINPAILNQKLDEFAAGSGGSIQSDWLQNDETQADYIKNRPFYETIEEQVICEPTQVELKDIDYVIQFEPMPGEYTLQVDDMYIKGEYKKLGAPYYDMGVEFEDGTKYAWSSFVLSNTLANLTGEHTVGLTGNIMTTKAISPSFMPQSVPIIKNAEQDCVPAVNDVDEYGNPVSWYAKKLQTVSVDDSGKLLLDGEETGIEKARDPNVPSGTLELLNTYQFTGNEGTTIQNIALGKKCKEIFIELSRLKSGEVFPSMMFQLGTQSIQFYNDSDVYYLVDIIHLTSMGEKTLCIVYNTGSADFVNTTDNYSIYSDNYHNVTLFNLLNVNLGSVANIRWKFNTDTGAEALTTQSYIKIYGR